ncbi:unnamed protein product [Gadus morhua 'NCC']
MHTVTARGQRGAALRERASDAPLVVAFRKLQDSEEPDSTTSWRSQTAPPPGGASLNTTSWRSQSEHHLLEEPV